MSLGLFIPSVWPHFTVEDLVALAIAAEEAEVETIWLPEHVVTFDSNDRVLSYGSAGTFDPIVVLAHLVAYTKRLRLGTGVALISQRQPLFFAKEIATLDHVSGGRVDVGVGVGWIREEFQALGRAREDRGRLADRSLGILLSLWCDHVSEYHDNEYDLSPCRSYPKPVQSPHPPIYVGGSSDAALRRVTRSGQGWIPFGLDVTTFSQRRGVLGRLLGAENRRLEDLTTVVCPHRPIDRRDVGGYADAGADQVVLSFPRERQSGDVRRELDSLLQAASRG
ncbi:MAG: TIGR03619 family F420-dependent LLM class oxidoreductase [Actinomycetota bacterium]|nr:TIGR03619 family F420-dependent LLM class oxidoreductase [Actinomycetota bacterium]